jgi:hypothetical protein
MIGIVKSKPTAPDEYTAFSNLLRKVLQASGPEVKAKIQAEKQARKRQRQSKIRTSGRASSDQA